MSAYTEQVLIDKLRLLSDSLQSIQTLSHWIMYHRKRHRTSVEIWKRELFKAPKDRRLLFLWLANDIVQTSRKKGNEFVKEFGKLLEPCIVFVYSDSNDKVKRQIHRMLDIWVERNVYAKEFIAALKANLDKAANNNPSSPAPVAPSSLEGESGLHMPFKDNAIAKAMRELEEAAIAQDLNAEKVTGIRSGLVDGRLLKQATSPMEVAALVQEINDASQILDQYRRSLESDLERRGNFITMLTECIVQQENTMNQTTNTLQDCLQQLARVEELKSQIKSLYPALSAVSGTSTYPTSSTATTPKISASSQPAALTNAHLGVLSSSAGDTQQSYAPLRRHQLDQGPATPTEEPPVDDEDDVILDASATNPYKKQKIFSAGMPAAATASSSTSSSLSSSAPPSTADGTFSSYAALQPLVTAYPSSSGHGSHNGSPAAAHLGRPVQGGPLPFTAVPPSLHPPQWAPPPAPVHHHHHSAHLPQPFDYGAPPH